MHRNTLYILVFVVYFIYSVADPGFIPYLGSEFFHPGSLIQGLKEPGSGSASKNLCIFSPKTVSKLSENVHPDPGQNPDYFSTPDPGSKIFPSRVESL
jgi:hypothetical protein